MLLLCTATALSEPIEKPVGNCKIFHGDGRPIFVQVRPNGTAHCRGSEGTQGSWKLVDGRLELQWSDGWRDVVVRVKSTYRKLGYAPGHQGQARPDHETAAYRRP